VLKELRHLVTAEHYGKPLRHAYPREVPASPWHLQRDPVHHFDRRNRAIHRIRRQFPLVDQVQLVLADRFEVQMLGALAVMLRECADVVDVCSLCGGCEATQLHVLDESLP